MVDYILFKHEMDLYIFLYKEPFQVEGVASESYNTPSTTQTILQILHPRIGNKHYEIKMADMTPRPPQIWNLLPSQECIWLNNISSPTKTQQLVHTISETQHVLWLHFLDTDTLMAVQSS